MILVILMTTSCVTLTGFPERSVNITKELELLQPYLAPEAITRYESKNIEDRKGLSQRAWRNEVVNARVREIDISFNQFQQQLFQEGVGSTLATDWTVLSLNMAGTLVSGNWPKYLSGASALTVGGKASFDKNAYFEKTMPALLATMVAKRKEVLVKIWDGLSKDIDDYSLNFALSDLDAYYCAGTILGAIIEVTETAGSTAKKADALLENLVIVTVLPKDIQIRCEKIAAFVKSLTPEQLDSLAKVMKVSTGENVMVDILTKVGTIETDGAVDAIAQKIKILFGKEF